MCPAVFAMEEEEVSEQERRAPNGGAAHKRDGDRSFKEDVNGGE
jgi:hypothetical protein